MTHLHDVGAIFFEDDPNITNTDRKFYLVYQGDCANDPCDDPHVLGVNLVQETGAKDPVAECSVCMEPKSSAAENSINYVQDRKCPVGGCGVFQPWEVIGVSLGPQVRSRDFLNSKIDIVSYLTDVSSTSRPAHPECAETLDLENKHSDAFSEILSSLPPHL